MKHSYLALFFSLWVYLTPHLSYANDINQYRKAAEQGDATAQYNLGLMYARGQGVVKSDKEAVKWFQKAAEQGHATAQYNLGLMYALGQGVVKSDKKAAFKWVRKAAEQGHAAAQYGLGLMYHDHGQGEVQNFKEAVEWHRKAAEQGHAKAQFNLGVMYVLGHGVVQSDSKAYAWFLLAKYNGDSDVEGTINKMKLTNNQREQGQDLAAKCVESNYRNCPF